MPTAPPQVRLRKSNSVYREQKQISSALRGYDYAWQKLREQYLAKHPLCNRCRQQRRTRAATQVHHVQPIRAARHRRLDWDNLESLCGPCHQAVHRHGGGGGKSLS